MLLETPSTVKNSGLGTHDLQSIHGESVSAVIAAAQSVDCSLCSTTREVLQSSSTVTCSSCRSWICTRSPTTRFVRGPSGTETAAADERPPVWG